MTGRVSITLDEWETRTPDGSSPLAGLQLDKASRAVAERLKEQGCMEVLELSRGLEIRATSFIGRVRLGDLTITVRPKVAGAAFLNLLRYAYQLRDLHLHRQTAHNAAQWAFQDLLVQELAVEATDLLNRGLHREYERVETDLVVPRGRIAFNRAASLQYIVRPLVPCIHHPRTDDTILNQVLMAGLIFAQSLTTDAELRATLAHLIKALGRYVSRLKLTGLSLEHANQAIDRRTTSYKPALTLTTLLFQSAGVSLDGGRESMRLPGFLFDMNRFFQALLFRYLTDHLLGFDVLDEHRLSNFFFYSPDANPRKRQAPVQKPDFVIHQHKRVVAILDAKYRDIWEQSLPREMLYQLAMYALAHPGTERRSVILYPTLASGACDQVIQFRASSSGGANGRVVLRPVKLLYLEEVLQARDRQAYRQRVALASQFAFGAALGAEAR